MKAIKKKNKGLKKKKKETTCALDKEVKADEKQCVHKEAKICL